MPKLAVLFHRLGPYHLARLNAAAALGEVVAVELSGAGGEYAWDAVTAAGFERVTVCPEGDSNTLPPKELRTRVEATLDAVRPDVLAVAGWGDRGMLCATRWGLRHRKPLVLMSDSQYRDEPRRWWKEWVKLRIVSGFGSALVAGTTHTDYLVRLGMPRDRIRTGYDVVDNGHFATGADAARNYPDTRTRLGLPERYFLAVGRFVSKKNLPVLLDAFAAYQCEVGPEAWDLVLVGDGPMRTELEARIDRLGIRESVRLPGFKQYHELPACYGLASAFVLPSVQDQWGLVVNEAMAAGLPVIVSDVCGCAPDLVREWKTGFTFPPTDVNALAEQMATLSTDPTRTAEMGRLAREHIADWSLARFASGLWEVARQAVPQPRSVVRSGLLKLLTRT